MHRRCLFVIAPLVLAACVDRSREPVGVQQPIHPLDGALAQVSQDATPDQMAVAQVVPGFGGYFLDGSGAPTVYLTDPSRRLEAERALAGFLADRGFSGADLRVRQGSYD